MQQKRLAEAEAVITSIYQSRLKLYGVEYHETLETMGTLADLMRRVIREECGGKCGNFVGSDARG